MKPAKNLEFDPCGFEDLAWWIDKDRKKAMRIVKLIREVQKNPFHGTGKPEPLKHDLSGCWSRRIDEEHRLIYELMLRQIVIPTKISIQNHLILLDSGFCRYDGSPR